MNAFLSALVFAAISAPVAQADVVTQLTYVTEYSYEEVDVLVDTNGVPYSTKTVSASSAVPTVVPSTSSSVTPVTAFTPSPSTSSSPAAPEPTSAPASHHSHSTDDYAYISQTSAEPTSAEPTSSASSEPASTSSTEAWTPSTSSTEAAWTPSTSSTEAAWTPTTSSSAPAPAWTPTTSSEPAPAPATTSSAPAPATTSSAPSGQTFNGDATYYDVGLGACGTTNTDDQLVAALNVDQFNGFGSMSNGNPACGKQATLNYEGKSVTVTIVDKCMGCKYGDLDLSPAAFQKLADESAGRIKISWSFI